MTAVSANLRERVNAAANGHPAPRYSPNAAALTTGQPPTLATRKPSGLPPWPMILLAGGEKTGKSYSLAAFSASDLIDRMFVFELGEGAIDQYGAMPGARFEVIDHDGTFRGLARQIWAATLEPRGESGRPHAIGLDSASLLWDLIVSEQQQLANSRRKRDEAPISMDQWNVAKKRWNGVVDLLRAHQGPTVLTARFEPSVVMDDQGNPTKARVWKVKAEKNLPYEVDAIVEFREPQKAEIAGLRSLAVNVPAGERLPFPEFTIDGLLRKMGLDKGVGERIYTALTADGYVAEYEAEQAAETARVEQARANLALTPEEWAARIKAAATVADVRGLWRELNSAGRLAVEHDGLTFDERIRGRVEAITAAADASPARGSEAEQMVNAEEQTEAAASLAAASMAADEASESAA